ncbi:Mu transposase C-terminal domain-containing protein [uncultured Flavobacterium sp.]|uniref:Mu transposase C-terminal domain-containing protein n=1 Tax=uncultured Flavobacterium sp. TaxID=165435 RepID=UPI002595947B|nr:Mu transposase C-terminal domain-containing protein [uncultured Flavobacterium sp.]
MGRINFTVGSKLIYKSNIVIIKRILSADTVYVEDMLANTFHTLNIKHLKSIDEDIRDNIKIDYLTSEQFDLALDKYKIIEPLLKKNTKSISVKEIANHHNISRATIYRWLETFNKSNVVSSLAHVKKRGGIGKSRLPVEIDNIINTSIENLYLNSSKYSITKVLRDIKFRCIENKLKIPSESAVRRRMEKIDIAVKEASRNGKKRSDEKYSPIKSPFIGGNFPLDTVQIDHCTLDIILVDEKIRKPYKRPILTVALDVFSRMVTGFYLSFDPSGTIGTGMCIGNSIVSKDALLEKYQIEGTWPCWGIMKTIHLDNAKEFRGNTLLKATQNYGINIEYRPLRTPHIGGHIESFFKTLSKEIHNLPGTTFSNSKARGEYNSIRRAAMTISELEHWLLDYIVNIYHKKIHSTIKMSPLQKYDQGITDKVFGIGIIPKIDDERTLRLNFLPYEERTVQRYGVVIDHIHYYSEVLNKYINRADENNNKRKFIFRKDPRYINLIYFLDPELNEYFEIPYRNILNPPMSRWEYKECLADLRKQNIIIDEEGIMNARKRHIKLEQQSITTTKNKRLKSKSRLSDKRNENVMDVYKNNTATSDEVILNISIDIKPFNNIDYGKFE